MACCMPNGRGRDIGWHEHTKTLSSLKYRLECVFPILCIPQFGVDVRDLAARLVARLSLAQHDTPIW